MKLIRRLFRHVLVCVYGNEVFVVALLTLHTTRPASTKEKKRPR